MIAAENPSNDKNLGDVDEENAYWKKTDAARVESESGGVSTLISNKSIAKKDL